MRLFHILGAGLLAVASLTSGAAASPQIDTQGKLAFPADYREWVFLSSGLDMSYSDVATIAGGHLFNNVFVRRDAYEFFGKSGSWPNGTVLILENRGAATNLSILKHGQIQTAQIMGLSAHVKDARFKGGWAFYSFTDDRKPAREIPHDAPCYSCHQAHGAVDTTFVQFYPTLLPVATGQHTLSAEYLAESAPKR